MQHWLLLAMLALVSQSLCQPFEQPSIVRSIALKRPNLVILGANLSKVELWAIPSGTGITPDEYMLLGMAKRRNPAGSKEIWLFPIPASPLSVTHIFAKGFDLRGRLIGTKSLPQQGVSQIYDALWGER